jgi:signal peptidase II
VNRKILTIAMVTLVVDQITKSILGNLIKLGTTKQIIKNFFYITTVHNDGAAWGIFSNQSIIIIIGTIISFFIIYKFIYGFKKNTRNNIAFGLVLGGLAGNLCDRLFLGYVRDFLDFIIFKYDFPVFNIADVAIVIGVILLIIAIIKGEDVNENNSKRSKRKTG